jgi:multimeric flavodoxin WrbA
MVDAPVPIFYILFFQGFTPVSGGFMKALAICGSPRENGNTERLLNRFLDHLKNAGHEVKLLGVKDMVITPCDGCGVCGKTKDGNCFMEGDDFEAVFKDMVEADILVVGSPVYFGSATPQIMALLDRAGYVSRANGNLFARKLGGPVAVARRAGQNFTFAQLLMWFMINDFVVPGSSYWNVAVGRAAGDVESDEEGLRTMDRFADNLVWLAEKLG